MQYNQERSVLSAGKNPDKPSATVFDLEQCVSETFETWTVVAPHILVLDFETDDKDEALEMWRNNQPAVLQRTVKHMYAPATSMEQWHEQLAAYKKRREAEKFMYVEGPEFS